MFAVDTGGKKGKENGGTKGKYRLFGANGNGNRGNDGDSWWKYAEWCSFKRLKRLRRRKNEPLSNIFPLAGSNVQ